MRRAILFVAALGISALPALAQNNAPRGETEHAPTNRMSKEMPPMTPGADTSAQTGTRSEQTGTGQTGQMQASEFKGLSVYGSDNQQIGEVAEARMGPDGKVQSLMIKTGQALGLGERTVQIESNKFQKSGDRINLQMTSDEVKNLPSASGGQSK